MASAARSTRARRKKSTFRPQTGSNPFMGKFNNLCPCQNCRGSRGLF